MFWSRYGGLLIQEMLPLPTGRVVSSRRICSRKYVQRAFVRPSAQLRPL